MPTKVKSLLNIASFVVDQLKARADRRDAHGKPIDDDVAEEPQSDVDIKVAKTP